MKHGVPALLLAVYVVLFAACAISPFDRAVWWTENIPILLIVGTLVFTYSRFRFSNTSYLMMMVLVVLHTIGGHYTFELVPFDFVTELFGFERNHYDRIAHFSVGFYAFAMAELLLVKEMVNSRVVLGLFPVTAILAVAGVYEIFEWQYAISADPAAGLAVLGSQGDIWDAQKDILADGLGAVFAMTVFWLMQRTKLAEPGGGR